MTVDVKTLQSAIKQGCEQVIALEPKLTEYDTQVGDGDCGTTLKRGAEGMLSTIHFPFHIPLPLKYHETTTNTNSTPTAVASYVSSLTGPTADAITTTHRIAQLTEQNMDGTSGAIFSIYLNSLVAGLRTTTSSSTTTTTKDWASAASSALKGLQGVTPAREGDRTLMDALIPFVATLEKSGDVKEAAKAARKGAEGTKGMKAKLGRSVYVGEEAYGRVPDPGAVGLAGFLEGLAEGC